ncbi:hypothetical protein GGR54DRAFT_628507 [Hypoxylon sp. NC1633]|nr:hypothetical protein GGR54DRAFT_628507 [Hypoxylon sp. NC1633]
MSAPQTNSSNTEQTYLSTSEGSITPARVVVIGAVFAGLALIAVALRFYVRLVRVRTFLGVDDWLILVSAILTLAMGLMMIIGSEMGGLAQPTPQGTDPTGYFTVTNDAEVLTEKIFWAFELVQCFAFGTAKLSVLFFYRRIFLGKVFSILSMILITFVLIWTFGFFFAILFRCGTNFRALWSPLKYIMANCHAGTPMFQAFSISDVITDSLILILPICRISRLQMTLTKKLAVCGVFLLGIVVVVGGALRLAIFTIQTNNPTLNADCIGRLTTEIFWYMIEMGMSVVAACLPTVWPLLGRFPVEAIFRSLRNPCNLLSPKSLPSPRSRHTVGKGSVIGIERGLGTSGPYERFSGGFEKVPVEDSGIDILAMHDLEAQQSVKELLPRDHIQRAHLYMPTRISSPLQSSSSLWDG